MPRRSGNASGPAGVQSPAGPPGRKPLPIPAPSRYPPVTPAFIPLLCRGGILGRFFGEFSVTLTPMLSARFLQPHHGRHGALYNFTEKIFDGLLRAYDLTLLWTLRHRAAVLLLSFAILGGTVYLFQLVPKGFIPNEDQGNILAIVEVPQGTSHYDMMANVPKLADIARKDPSVEAFFFGTGGTSGAVATGGPNFGRMFFYRGPVFWGHKVGLITEIQGD